MADYEKRIKNLDYGELKEVVTLINGANLDGIEKLRVVGITKPKMVEAFTSAVETIASKHGEDSIPEKALLLFNDIYSDDATKLDSAPEPRVDTAGKKKDTPAKPKTKTKPAPEPNPEPEPDPEPEAETKPAPDPEPEAETKPASDPEPEAAPDPKKKSGSSNKKSSDDTDPPVYEVDKYGTLPNTLARCFIESLQSEPKTMDEIQKEKWNSKGFIFPRTVERLVNKKLAAVDGKGIITLLK